MNIEDCIVTVKSDSKKEHEFFDHLVKYMEIKCTRPAEVAAGLYEDIRKVKDYPLTGSNLKTDLVFSKLIDQIISKYYITFSSRFKFLHLTEIREIDLLKYESGGKYEPHVDSGTSMHREVTCIINLNDDFEGGDFVFWDTFGKKEIKRVNNSKGTIIFFPSSFLFPHQIEPITKGTRYSIVSWLR